MALLADVVRAGAVAPRLGAAQVHWLPPLSGSLEALDVGDEAPPYGSRDSSSMVITRVTRDMGARGGVGLGRDVEAVGELAEILWQRAEVAWPKASGYRTASMIPSTKALSSQDNGPEPTRATTRSRDGMM